ncbi:MAG: radical SAM protein [Paludibacteraceae bacterium]|nr:radical SAM protein [Paludibacteraceae bacterium]
MMKISQYIYLGWWFVRARFFGRRKPLQTVLFITDKCNLQCKHCSVYGITGGKHRPFADIVKDLQWAYDEGSRFVDIEGGEPTLYRDGDKNLNDVIAAAREIGFFSITITTNAQQDFSWVNMDSLWVSMDGVGQYHERVRGEGTFARLEKNIAAFHTAQRSLLTVNMVVNSLNIDGLEQALEYAHTNPAIDKIAINMHTPFAGTESLALTQEQREHVIDTVLAYKRKGYKVMNSYSGLKKMRHVEKLTNRCWVTSFIYPNGARGFCVGLEPQQLPQTLNSKLSTLNSITYTPTDLCKHCGFCMSGEMASVFNFCPDTLLAGLSLRM